MGSNMPRLNDELKREIAAVVLGAFTLICVMALTGPGSAGAVGRAVQRALILLFGRGAVLIPLAMGGYSLLLLFRLSSFNFTWKKAGAALWVLLGIILIQVARSQPGGEFAAMENGGGYVGAALAYALYRGFGAPGRLVMLVALGLVALSLTLQRPMLSLLAGVRRGLGRSVAGLRGFVGNRVGVEEPLIAKVRPGLLEGPGIREDLAFEGEPVEKKVAVKPRSSGEDKPKDFKPKEEAQTGSYQQVTMEDAALYKLPPLSILDKPGRLRAIRGTRDVPEKVRILEDTLESFGVKAKVIDVIRGPTITRFEIQPAPGVKVSRIVNLADDIALSLAATGVRIEAPIPGKAALGIEVPNREISPVYLREVLETPEFRNSSSPLTVGLGKDISGKPIVSRLEKMLHLLVAGATGSGKSVCLNAIICSLLFKATPDELKFVMIDPKVVELNQYNGIPHLLAPVITDARKAAGVLKWVVVEMERRYELFASLGVRDIRSYHTHGAARSASAQDHLPYIVVIIDELADLMMIAAVEVEDTICRLAQMARAAGIHLVVATQRPSVDVITGLIKANIPSRIAFAVSSQVDSRTILDAAGAEKLVGKGDMLFHPVGAPKPIRVQGAFISDKEVEALTEHVRHQAEPKFDESVLKVEPPAEEAERTAQMDELFPQALRVVVESGQASVSLLQRRLRVGYSRAARLIDQMEEMGYVGKYEGTKPREVLISAEDYKKIYDS